MTIVFDSEIPVTIEILAIWSSKQLTKRKKGKTIGIKLIKKKKTRNVSFTIVLHV